MRTSRSLAILAALALFNCAGLHAGAGKSGMVLSGSGNFALSNEKTSPPSEMPSGSDEGLMYRSMGTLLCLAGLLGGAWLLVRRFKCLRTAPGMGTNRMEVLERLVLGPRRELMLVRAGNRVLVLADFNQQLRMVANLSQESFERGQGADFEALLRDEHASDNSRQLATANADLINWPTAPTRS